MKNTSITIFFFTIVLIAASTQAVGPVVTVHTTEADFGPGEKKSLVVSSRGELSVSARIKVLFNASDAPAVISAVVMSPDAIFASAGNDNVIYRIVGEKVTKFAELPSAMVASLLWSNGKLFAGTGGGARGGIYEVDAKGTVKRIWSSEDVKYIWAMAPGPGQSIYAATGANASVMHITAKGGAKQLYKLDPELGKNFLALAVGKKGMLYAGTDTTGLVFEIDPEAKTGRVILDAPEKEIAALVAGASGGVYAATSDSAKAGANGETPANQEENGRTETPATPSNDGNPANADGGGSKSDTSTPGQSHDNDLENTKNGCHGHACVTVRMQNQSNTQEKCIHASITQDSLGCASVTMAPKRVNFCENTKAYNAVALTSTPTGVAPIFESTHFPGRRVIAKDTSNPTAEENAERIRKLIAKAQAAVTAGEHALDNSGSSRSATPSPSGSGGPAMPGGTGASQETSDDASEGNAIYFIRPDGLVETLIRRPVTFLAMIKLADKLICATGNGGKVYSISLDGDELVALADTEAAQITSLAVGPGKTIIMGTANAGSVVAISSDLAESGSITSSPIDASQIAKWGTIKTQAFIPAGGALMVSSRTGNLAQPSDETWSKWSREIPVKPGLYLAIASPAGRFCQYRYTFKGGAVLKQVQLIHQVGNLPPTLTGVTATASAGPDGAAKSMVFRQVAIAASDRNGDSLVYQVQFRKIGTKPWITLVKELAEPQMLWDTREVGDGQYELRVTASDSPSNPLETARKAARISEPITVDNTVPLVKSLTVTAKENSVAVTGNVSDASSRIVSIAYSVDSQNKWITILPEDGICDSNAESIAISIKDLTPGSHRIAVKVIDELGNVGYASVQIEI